MVPRNEETPAGGRGSLQLGAAQLSGGMLMLAQPSPIVKSDLGLLISQAVAAQRLAEAKAGFHLERAQSYLRFVDIRWAAARYAEHIAAAEEQERIAARHAAILQQLGGEDER